MQTVFIISVFLVCIVLLSFIVGFLRIVISIPTSRWAEAHALSGSATQALHGEVQADPNGLRDPRIAKGKVWDNATSKWLPQGKLSDEYLNSLAE
jgi:hypothetical protein